VADFAIYIAITILWIFPTWIIFIRVGLNPAISLSLIIPMLGDLIVMGWLVRARWPSDDDKEQES
jgi:hypothetical protein